MRSLSEIETTFDVASIRANGVQIWPFLRWYVVSKKEFSADSLTGKTIPIPLKLIVRSMFYGFTNLFKGRAEFIFFSDTSERKRINSLYFDKSVDFLAQKLSKSIYFELPLPKHFDKKEIPTNRIASKLPLYVLVRIVSIFLIGLKVENELLLIQLLERLEIKLNHKAIIRYHLAQNFIGKWLIYFYKPKALILQCYYTNMGFVKAFRDQGLDVIEVQHGLIGTEHEAYNIPIPLDALYFPSHLLVFGEDDRQIFNKRNFFITPDNVHVIGNFYLDHITRTTINESILRELRKQYSTIVAISSQKYIEEELIEFVKNASRLDESILYIFIPRERTRDYEKLFQGNNNIILINNLNTYEIISISDIHATVSSTCATEAPSLGAPNVLINIRDLSSRTFSQKLLNSEYTRLTNTPVEFVEGILELRGKSRVDVVESNSTVFSRNYKANVEEFLARLKYLQ